MVNKPSGEADFLFCLWFIYEDLIIFLHATADSHKRPVYYLSLPGQVWRQNKSACVSTCMMKKSLCAYVRARGRRIPPLDLFGFNGCILRTKWGVHNPHHWYRSHTLVEISCPPSGARRTKQTGGWSSRWILRRLSLKCQHELDLSEVSSELWNLTLFFFSSPSVWFIFLAKIGTFFFPFWLTHNIWSTGDSRG